MRKVEKQHADFIYWSILFSKPELTVKENRSKVCSRKAQIYKGARSKRQYTLLSTALRQAHGAKKLLLQKAEIKSAKRTIIFSKYKTSFYLEKDITKLQNGQRGKCSPLAKIRKSFTIHMQSITHRTVCTSFLKSYQIFGE